MFKRIHIFILTPIVVFGLAELNLYYIILLIFFVKYASSLVSYRKSGNNLVGFAAFFIWINYFWSIAQPYFDKDDFTSKIFMMLTFSKYSSSS
jgi:hypothetical protein